MDKDFYHIITNLLLNYYKKKNPFCFIFLLIILSPVFSLPDSHLPSLLHLTGPPPPTTLTTGEGVPKKPLVGALRLGPKMAWNAVDQPPTSCELRGLPCLNAIVLAASPQLRPTSSSALARDHLSWSDLYL